MITERQKAVARTTALNNDQQNVSYRNCALKANENLKEKIGLLLCHLHSPLSQRQRAMGWKLFEVLLVQYLVVKGEIQ